MSWIGQALSGSTSRHLSAAAAKKTYFLTPADLATLPHEKLGGWGCGNSKVGGHANRLHIVTMAMNSEEATGFERAGAADA